MVRTLTGVWREVARALDAGAHDRGSISRFLFRPEVARTHTRRKVAGAVRVMLERGFLRESTPGRLDLTAEGREGLERGDSGSENTPQDECPNLA